MFKLSKENFDGLKEAPLDSARRSLVGEAIEFGYGLQLSDYTEKKQNLCLLHVGTSPLKTEE